MADMMVAVDTAVTVPVNVFPLTDDTDFKTQETAVAYNAAGMALKWNFQTEAGVTTQTAVTPTTSGVYDWTHNGGGMYEIEIPASGGGSINNDTEGFGWFSGVATGVLSWRGPVIQFRKRPASRPSYHFTKIRGATLQTVNFPVFRTDGAPYTGLLYNTSGLTAYYYRQNAASATSITLATMTLGTWETGGLVLVSDANMPGEVQLGIPDAALASATGVDYVRIQLKGVTGMENVTITIDLVDQIPLGSDSKVQITTDNMTEAYPTDGAAMSLQQAQYAMVQMLSEFSRSGTTVTIKKRDGSTTAFTLTLDDATTPTSSTQAS